MCLPESPFFKNSLTGASTYVVACAYEGALLLTCDEVFQLSNVIFTKISLMWLMECDFFSGIQSDFFIISLCDVESKSLTIFP